MPKKGVMIPGGQPLPDPATARPVVVPPVGRKKPSTPARPPKKPAKKVRTGGIRTEVAVVFDKSDSMSSIANQAISGYNEYVNGLKKTADETMRFSLTLFDTSIYKPHVSIPVSSVPLLSRETYRPGGCTALLDAVGKTINDLDLALKDETEYAVLFVIQTDGQENSSREYNLERIRDMIVSRQAKGNWTFVFLGADQNAWDGFSRHVGIPKANTMSYDSNRTGETMTMARLSTSRWHSGVKLGGVAQSTSFFSPDDDSDDDTLLKTVQDNNPDKAFASPSGVRKR